MGRLFGKIRLRVEEGRYSVGVHAANTLEMRGIVEWQAVAGLSDSKLLVERPNARPNACVEVEQELPDGTVCKAVWAYLPISDAAKLVTIHFYNR